MRHWLLIADDTAPVLSAVHVDAFWSTGHEIVCAFSEAEDRESGVQLYEVAVVGFLGASSHDHRGVVIGMQTELCGAGSHRVTVPAKLAHAHRYRCVVTAINSVGLRAAQSSLDFVADLSATSSKIRGAWAGYS